MRILLYGRLAEAIDRQVDVDFPCGCSVGELRGLLSRAHPRAADHLLRSRAVIGNAVVGDEHVAMAGDQVEFLPPVSGG